uniref:Mitochondrial ribosomal protein S24 n=1 Tax=Ailuropoda melanoleuca TaxID=9646 RepID=A0A7N5J9U0_AILME
DRPASSLLAAPCYAGALRWAQDGGALVLLGAPATGAFLEPRATVLLARPAYVRGLRQGNLDGEDHAAERTVEDVFLRKFMLGTFPGCLADQLILKRRANQLEICALVLRQLPAHKFYFLVGYSETLLSHFYKCPVRLHLQTVPSKVVYKYI